MRAKALKYGAFFILGLIVIITAAVLVLPSTVGRMAARQALDDLGIAHQGIDTVDVSLFGARVAAGPVTLGSGDRPITAERLELSVDPTGFFADQAHVNALRLSGADIMVRRLPDGDIEFGGIKLSDLTGKQPEQNTESGTEGEAAEYGFAVDRLEITNSTIFVQDINGGEFELAVKQLLLNGLRSWDPEKIAELSISALFNGIQLNHKASLQLFSEPKRIRLEGNIRQLTAAKLARAAGEPLDPPIAGTVSTTSRYDIALTKNGEFKLESHGTVMLEGFAVETPEGEKLAVPNAELALDLVSEGGGDLQRKVSGDVTLSADRIELASPAGDKVAIADLTAGGTQFDIVDVSGSRESILRSAWYRGFGPGTGGAGKSIVTMLLETGVAVAEEIGRRNLQIRGNPAVSIGETSALIADEKQPGVVMLDATVASASIGAEDVEAGAIDGVWKIAGALAAQASNYKSKGSHAGGTFASELASVDLALGSVAVETDGNASSMTAEVSASLTGVKSEVAGKGSIAIERTDFVSPEISVSGGNSIEEQASGALTIALRGISGSVPDKSGDIAFSGGALHADLSDLDMRQSSFSGGGGLVLGDWKLNQAGSGVSAAFTALKMDLPSVLVSVDGKMVRIRPPSSNGKGGKAAEDQGATQPDKNGKKASPPAADPKAEPADETPAPGESRLKLAGGIPIPPPKPAGMPAEAQRGPVFAVIPDIAGNGVLGIKVEGLRAKAPRGNASAELTGGASRVALHHFTIATGTGTTAVVGGSASFNGWRLSDPGQGNSAGFDSLRVTAPSLKTVIGAGVTLAGAVDTMVQGVTATVPGDGGRKWDVTVASAGAKLSQLTVDRSQISAAGDVGANTVNARESGERGHVIAVTGITGSQAEYTPARTNIGVLAVEGLQAVLSDRLIDDAVGGNTAAGKPDGAPAAEKTGVAPLRIGQLTVSPGSRVSITGRDGAAPALDIQVDHASAAPLDLSNPATVSEIQAAVRVNRSGNATLDGALPPLDPKRSLDVKVRVSGIETKPFSPYFKEAFGVGLAGGTAAANIYAKGNPTELKGKMNVVLKQFATEPMTEEQKKAFMDKYTFSPEYIIDILSDSNGVIDLTVPLKGTTTAPDFDVSGIAVKAAGGMAAKVVTAPLDSAGSAAKGVVDVAGGTAKTAADAAGKAVQGSLRAVGSLLKTISPFGK